MNDKKRKKSTSKTFEFRLSFEFLRSFSVDDEETPQEKKTSRNKKLNSQQSTTERRDSTLEDSTVLSSTNDTQDLLTPTRLDPYTPPIVGSISYIYLSNSIRFQQATYAPLSLNEMPATPNPLMNSKSK